jgi:hypothetical protein
MDGNIIELPRKNRPQREQQIARIMALLEDLEDLASNASNLPLPLLLQTHNSIEKARYVLDSCAQRAPQTCPAQAGESDLQPEVDRDVLDRIYRN